MKKAELKKKAEAAQAMAQKAGATASVTSERPVTSPGAMAFMAPTIGALNERAEVAEARAAELEEKLSQAPVEVELDKLIEVPGRRRKLSQTEYSELKANLAKNPLIHPVAVKKMLDGRFEIVSGANRTAAYRELGRRSIRVAVVEIEEALIERSAFYANLLQPSLPDYEKYQGFRKERDRTGHSQKKLAEEAGVDEAVVSMLFSFEHLPEQAKTLIESRPDCIGMNCANELAKATKDGFADGVVESIELLVQGKIAQKDAVTQARKRQGAQKPAPSPAKPIKVKAGRSDYCQLVARANVIRIEFKSEQAREEAQMAIQALLSEKAKVSVGDQ